MQRIVALASGSGSLLQAIIDSRLGPSVVAVGSDNEASGALERARRAGISTFVLPVNTDRDRWNAELLETLRSLTPDLIVCAGFMRVLGPSIVAAFGRRIVNSHPALLPAFPGAHAVRDALAYGVKVTGCTIHLVDDGVDTGPIIAQQPVSVEASDTEESLHERIKQVERVLLVDVLERLIASEISLSGRVVTFE